MKKSSDPKPNVKVKPSSSSTPVEGDLSLMQPKQRLSNEDSPANDPFSREGKSTNELEMSKAIFNPFDGSYVQDPFTVSAFHTTSPVWVFINGSFDFHWFDRCHNIFHVMMNFNGRPAVVRLYYHDVNPYPSVAWLGIIL